jgi:DNA-binding XRE family transcriptional regulator/mannose-6-phosphate isomerase-like protein (cupin superfamily)
MRWMTARTRSRSQAKRKAGARRKNAARPAAVPTDPIADRRDAFHFGDRLRTFRKQRKWSLEHAAEMVGVPASTLSRIENRKMSPTLDLIQKIIRSMGLHPYDVLGRDPTREGSGTISVTRRGTGDYTELPNILYAPLHPDFPQTRIRPIQVTLFARSVEEYGGVTAHSGEEFLYVLQGAVEIHFEGRPTERLEEGDSIFFDSHVPHAYVAAGRTQAKFLIVASTLDRPFDSAR